MQLHEENLSKEFEYIDIKPISDVHIGDPQMDEQLIQEDINWVTKEDNRFLLLNGDIMNTATTHSVSNTYENTMTPHQELKYARKLFEPAKGKILGMTAGNHERRIYRNDGLDVCEELAMSLGCFYSMEGIVLKVRFGKRKLNGKKQTYTIYMSHGSTGSRTTGGKANRLDKLRNIVVTDVYIVSHSHQKITFNKDIFIPDTRNGKVMRKNQTFINTGAYLKYGGYGQVKAYPPTDLGTVTLRLYGNEKRKEVIF